MVRNGWTALSVLALILLATAIVVFAMLPADSLRPFKVVGSDHLFAFFILASATRALLPGLGWPMQLLGLSVFSVLIELSQPVLSRGGHTFEWTDMGTNFAGTAAALLLAELVARHARAQALASPPPSSEATPDQ